MLFNAVIVAVVLTITVHAASYGLYAWHVEKNKRGAIGVFIIAWLTLITPPLVWLLIPR